MLASCKVLLRRFAPSGIRSPCLLAESLLVLSVAASTLSLLDPHRVISSLTLFGMGWMSEVLVFWSATFMVILHLVLKGTPCSSISFPMSLGTSFVWLGTSIVCRLRIPGFTLFGHPRTPSVIRGLTLSLSPHRMGFWSHPTSHPLRTCLTLMSPTAFSIGLSASHWQCRYFSRIHSHGIEAAPVSQLHGTIRISLTLSTVSNSSGLASFAIHPGLLALGIWLSHLHGSTTLMVFGVIGYVALMALTPHSAPPRRGGDGLRVMVQPASHLASPRFVACALRVRPVVTS